MRIVAEPPDQRTGIALDVSQIDRKFYDCPRHRQRVADEAALRKLGGAQQSLCSTRNTRRGDPSKVRVRVWNLTFKDSVADA